MRPAGRITRHSAYHCTDRTHARERRPQAKRRAQNDVGRRARVLASLDEGDGFMAESRKGGEASTESDHEEGTHRCGGLHVEEVAGENSNQEAPKNVY